MIVNKAVKYRMAALVSTWRCAHSDGVCVCLCVCADDSLVVVEINCTNLCTGTVTSHVFNPAGKNKSCKSVSIQMCKVLMKVQQSSSAPVRGFGDA